MTHSLPRIGILGATGRMGRAVIAATADYPGVVLGAAIGRRGAPETGMDAGQLSGTALGGVPISDDLSSVIQHVDVLIDFTRPESTLSALALCQTHGKALVIGTTGFDDGQRAQIAAAARHIPILMAGNFSIGVNLCLQLIETAARVLGSDVDIEILEAHHRHKVDAPSGTALMMGEAAANGADRALSHCATYTRHGHTGARARDTIGFSSVRGGDIIGDHTVFFLGDGERIEITHKASSRTIFAKGAVRAAEWLSGQPGDRLYAMRDVLSA